ncbi:MAG: hypothetical protein AAGG50_10670 [Bacteroidota bacterium]
MAINLAFHHGVRPVAHVVPLQVLDAVGAVALAPIALASAVLGGRRARSYLALTGHPTDFASLLRFTYLDLRERLRSYFFFVDPRFETRSVAGAEDARSGVQLTTLHAGMRYLGWWTKQRDGRIVYIPDPLELAGGPDGVPMAEKWPYFTHDAHHRAFGSHHVAPGGAFRKLAPVLADGRPVFLCQEAVWMPTAERPANATLFGVPVFWPVGARVLGGRTGAPVVFSEVRFERGRWRFVQDGPLAFDDDDALRRYVEDRLRARPWAWGHWRVFMDELAATRPEPHVAEPVTDAAAEPVV